MQMGHLISQRSRKQPYGLTHVMYFYHLREIADSHQADQLTAKTHDFEADGDLTRIFDPRPPCSMVGTNEHRC